MHKNASEILSAPTISSHLDFLSLYHCWFAVNFKWFKVFYLIGLSVYYVNYMIIYYTSALLK